ncbi:CRISPR-associated helicase Cas3' [Urbifossiella limnaea]|uniref:Helicase Cas3 n=1 Tax=Urbifossiella limnaea TaxID=2528023 RepID=A0A517XUT6_9BACT|nr:CRISPR-associated helicase Cas3' [Urbifossiella limnaea]QDU21268.1 helicase Cas3 [Urbifossiella limnaea]
MTFYAHSARDTAGRPAPALFQLLAEHLRSVAAAARARAVATRMPGLAAHAAAAGLLHDLGKYRPGFQRYIHPDYPDPPLPDRLHKEAGAARAAAAKCGAVAFAIFGHHGGLPDLADLQSGFKSPAADWQAVWAAAVADLPDLATALDGLPPVPREFAADLFARVLFACLVDADWADTTRHEQQTKGYSADPAPPPLAPEKRWKHVEAHLAGLAARPLEPHVKAARATVLAACLAAAEKPPGLFSLTVPTGGGKTLAALAFALKHAERNHLRRVIYVAPYTTILEQNADVIREALGVSRHDAAVLEHHSLAEPPGDADTAETRREAAARRAENWDAPVVVTTNVQFFESLFSNKPGRCRKLHNVAGSVVVLDECQSLPPGLVAPTCGMLKQLTAPVGEGGLGCTVVLCTATQPAFDHDLLKADERLTAEEIIPGDANLFTSLKRVDVVWPKRDDPKLSWAEVAERMRDAGSALCVVNTKKAARAVFAELAAKRTPGAFHLSTGMCPQHRREKLAQVRGLLDAKAPCFVVSTQLIEAGVDVDFPFLMREMGPLESVIQAAGRCNREGKRPWAESKVVVFRSAEGTIPGGWYTAGRDKLEQIIAANGDGPRVDDPDTITDYFRRLYFTGGPGALDAPGVLELRRAWKFRAAAEAYKLIDDAGQPVVVRAWKSHEAEIAALLVELESAPRKSTYRALARFQVNLLPSKMAKLGHLYHEGPGKVLVWDGEYDEDAGIVEEMADVFVL